MDAGGPGGRGGDGDDVGGPAGIESIWWGPSQTLHMSEILDCPSVADEWEETGKIS